MGAHKWHVGVRSPAEDSTHALGLSATIQPADDSAVPSAILTYCLELPGEHERCTPSDPNP